MARSRHEICHCDTTRHWRARLPLSRCRLCTCPLLPFGPWWWRHLCRRLRRRLARLAMLPNRPLARRGCRWACVRGRRQPRRKRLPLCIRGSISILQPAVCAIQCCCWEEAWTGTEATYLCLRNGILDTFPQCLNRLCVASLERLHRAALPRARDLEIRCPWSRHAHNLASYQHCGLESGRPSEFVLPSLRNLGI